MFRTLSNKKGLSCIPLFLVMIFGVQNSNGQTVLIDPSGDGGFENGSTLIANGWSEKKANSSFWEVGSIATQFNGNRGVYIAKTNGTFDYDGSNQRTSHIYKDVSIPLGVSSLTLSFYWKGRGVSNKDQTLIYTSPTSVTPAVNSPSSSASNTAITGATLVWKQPNVQTTLAYTLATINLPISLAGTSVRLIFTWQNGANGYTSPGAAIDDISLVYTTCSPLSGIKTVGTTGADYTSLTGPNGLFAAINSCGLSGNLTTNITSNLTETGEVSLNQWSETGSGNYTLTIQPDATTTRVVSGTAVATGLPMINFNGADRVTINGINKNLLFRNTNSTSGNTGSTIRFTNGSLNCSIMNCDVQSNGTTPEYGTIVIGSAGTNSVIISNNDIHGTTSGNSYTSVYSNNAANTLTITNNKIYDFYVEGIFALNIANVATITGNSFYQTAICNYNGQYAIDIYAGNGHTISNNYIGGTAPNCGGSPWENNAKVDFRAISLSVGATTATSVQGNTIQNIKLSSVNNSSTATIFYMISVDAGLVNVGTVSGNIIGHVSLSNSISFAGRNSVYYSALIDGSNSFVGSIFANNVIANITYTGTSNPICNGIVLNGSAKNNSIYSIGATLSDANPFLRGINIVGTSGGEVSNNFIALSGGSGATQSEIYGIYDNTPTGATYTIYYNSVNITGIPNSFVTTWAFFRGESSTTNYVLKNNIFANQRTAATGTKYNGAIYVFKPGNFTSDFNDLYSAGTTFAPIGHFNGSYKTSFANWQASFSGCDTNSINVLPQFTSDTDLHLLSSNCGIDGKATPIGITKDYDSQTRDVIHPDMGADEFTGILLIPSITTPPSNFSIAAGANAVFSTIASGNPTSYLWEVSTNNGSNWSTVNNGGVYTNVTTASLTITAAPASMNGYVYRATAINSCGSITSNTAILSVLNAGCVNTTQFPTTTINAPTNNTVLIISNSQTQNQYNAINVTVPSTFISSYNRRSGCFITVHSGSYDGPIVNSGYSSLTWTAATTGIYYIHYNTTSDCGTDNNTRTSTIECTTCTSTSLVPNTQDCLGSIKVCNNTYNQPNSYSGTGNVPNEIDSSNSCLGSGEKNDVWYTFTVVSSGNLNFTITPNQLTDDYDWAIYNLTNANCSDIFSNSSLMVSCNYSATSGITGTTSSGSGNSQSNIGTPFNNTIPVIAGQTYVVNISNFSTTQYGYTLNFGNSTAIIYDNIAPSLQTLVQPVACGVSSLSFNFSEPILCSSINNSNFSLTGPGGTYSLSGITGLACNIGVGQEKNFTINVNPPLTFAGNYTLYYNGNGQDLCGNLAAPHTINFTVTTGLAANAGVNQTICMGGTIQLTGSATGGTTYTYSWSPTTGLSSSTISNPIATPLTTTTYTMTATANGCSVSDEVLVSVLTTPTYGAIPSTVNHVVISQIYGGGGNSGGIYTNDFVELFNPTNAPISLANYSLQYASDAGNFPTTNSNKVNLSGTIQGGGYFLIQLFSGGIVGVSLPTPDLSSTTINLDQNTGKIALVNTQSPLNSGICPTSIVDFVGYGSSNCSEGSASAPSLTSAFANFRNGLGGQDTDVNSIDFTKATPNPRNSSSLTQTNQSFCISGTPNLMVVNGTSGSGSFSYQWYSQPGIVSAPSGNATTGWTSLGTSNGANTNIYTPPSAINASTTYACFVTPSGTPTCGSGSWASGVRQIVVNNIDWVNLQSPQSGSICANGIYNVYGQIYVAGLTNPAGAGAGIVAELGYSTSNTNPNTWTNWVTTSFNAQAGNNDEYKGIVSGLLAGTYYYAFRYSLNGCPYKYGGINGVWNNDSGVLTVYGIPTVAVAGSNQTICDNSTLTLAANSPTLGTGQWSISSGPNTNTSQFSNLSSNSSGFSPTNFGKYTLTWTISNGSCPSSSSSLEIVVNNIDWANTQWPQSGSICANSSIIIYGQVYDDGITNPAGADTGIVAQLGYSSTNTNPNTWTNWISSAYNPTPLITNNNDEYTATLSGLTAGTYYYAFRYSLNGCPFKYGGNTWDGTTSVTGGFWNGTSNVSGVLTVNLVPNVTISGQTTICNGSNTTLNANGANTYLWSNGLGTLSSITVSPTNSTSYTVTGTNLNNCTNTANINVIVNTNPTTNPIYHE